MRFASLFISKCALFPFDPDFWAVTCGGLLAVSDNGGLHQGRIVENLVFLGTLIVHIFHQCDIRRFTVPVDEIIDAANGTKHAVELLSGHTKANQVNGLVFDPALLEPALSFLCIEAFVFTKNLDVQ